MTDQLIDRVPRFDLSQPGFVTEYHNHYFQEGPGGGALYCAHIYSDNIRCPLTTTIGGSLPMGECRTYRREGTRFNFTSAVSPTVHLPRLSDETVRILQWDQTLQILPTDE